MHVKVIILKNDRKIFIMTNSLYITFLKTHFCEYIILDHIWTIVMTLSGAGFYEMTEMNYVKVIKSPVTEIQISWSAEF